MENNTSMGGGEEPKEAEEAAGDFLLLDEELEAELLLTHVEGGEEVWEEDAVDARKKSLDVARIEKKGDLAATMAWEELMTTSEWIASNTSQIETQLIEAAEAAAGTVLRDRQGDIAVLEPARAPPLASSTGGRIGGNDTDKGANANFGAAYLSLPVDNRQEIALAVEGMVEAVAAAEEDSRPQRAENVAISDLPTVERELELAVRQEAREKMEHLDALLRKRDEVTRNVAAAVVASGAAATALNEREAEVEETWNAKTAGEAHTKEQERRREDIER
jgi:hypothetical protein